MNSDRRPLCQRVCLLVIFHLRLNESIRLFANVQRLDKSWRLHANNDNMANRPAFMSTRPKSEGWRQIPATYPAPEAEQNRNRAGKQR